MNRSSHTGSLPVLPPSSGNISQPEGRPSPAERKPPRQPARSRKDASSRDSLLPSIETKEGRSSIPPPIVRHQAWASDASEDETASKKDHPQGGMKKRKKKAKKKSSAKALKRASSTSSLKPRSLLEPLGPLLRSRARKRAGVSEDQAEMQSIEEQKCSEHGDDRDHAIEGESLPNSSRMSNETERDHQGDEGEQSRSARDPDDSQFHADADKMTS